MLEKYEVTRDMLLSDAVLRIQVMLKFLQSKKKSCLTPKEK